MELFCIGSFHSEIAWWFWCQLSGHVILPFCSTYEVCVTVSRYHLEAGWLEGYFAAPSFQSIFTDVFKGWRLIYRLNLLLVAGVSVFFHK